MEQMEQEEPTFEQMMRFLSPPEGMEFKEYYEKREKNPFSLSDDEDARLEAYFEVYRKGNS